MTFSFPTVDTFSTTFSPLIVKENSTKGRIKSADRGTFAIEDLLSDVRGVSGLPEIQNPLSPSQEKLRAKWLIALTKARELKELHPDPIQEMINLLGKIPGDYETWREIIEEPYG